MHYRLILGLLCGPKIFDERLTKMKLHKIALGSIPRSGIDGRLRHRYATPNDAKGPTAHSEQRSIRSRSWTPKFGQNITGTNTAVKAVLRAGEIRPESLRLALNGRNVTRLLRKGECQDDACKWTVELTKADGLHAGRNRLVALARGPAGTLEMQRVNSSVLLRSAGRPGSTHYLPSTVGLSLNPGGAQPWVTLTTGTPSNLQDNADRTQYSLPQPDTTFPMTTQMPCTTRYQVVVLNRLNPAQEDGYMCPGDASTLKSDLAGLTKGTELVLVGTTLNNNADAGLDTTSIGGTNYSASNSWKPMGYAAIGVSGAAPGSAYESYYIASDVGKAYRQTPSPKAYWEWISMATTIFTPATISSSRFIPTIPTAAPVWSLLPRARLFMVGIRLPDPTVFGFSYWIE